MSIRTTNLDAFFPLPSEAPSSRAPARLAGITRASSEALVNALKDNHTKWHAFFNDRGFHNHASHHLVAIYAMGAGAQLIEEAYQTHVVYMKPAFESPEAITEANFWTHLGKENYYNSYLEFFRALLLEKDVTEVLEEYIFSAKANVGGEGTKGQPRMLTRYLASVIHPIIHTGCGLEFGLLGLVAEGLAQTAVHPIQGAELYPPSLFPNTEAPSALTRLVDLLPSLNLSANEGNATSGAKKNGVHAFTILSRMIADAKFAPASLGLPLPPAQRPFSFSKITELVGDAIVQLSNEWIAEIEGDNATPVGIARKIEEVAWMNALLYGVPGWAHRAKSPTKEFNADFFFMHLVTSSLFLPSTVAYLSPASAVLLLRTYFSISLAFYVAQGRPTLPIREFYEHTTATAAPPIPSPATPTPAKDTLTPGDAAPNAWLPIVQTTLVHPAEHLCKIQRALMHNATLYGTRAPGDFSGLGLEGAEVLDGTLFVRVAGLTADRIGWMKEGQAPGDWDRTGFF